MSKTLCPACATQKQKITVSNPINYVIVKCFSMISITYFRLYIVQLYAFMMKNHNKRLEA